MFNEQSLEASLESKSHILEKRALPDVVNNVGIRLLAKLAVMVVVRINRMQFAIAPAAQAGDLVDNVSVLLCAMLASPVEHLNVE